MVLYMKVLQLVMPWKMEQAKRVASPETAVAKRRLQDVADGKWVSRRSEYVAEPLLHAIYCSVLRTCMC